MEKFIIKGGKKLSGEIKVMGAKNAALKFLAASVLANKEWKLSNVPDIEDIRRIIEILSDLGVKVEKKRSGAYSLNASGLKDAVLDEDKTRKLRASIVLVGPLLARTGKVEFCHPGGCVLGKRPIDIFLEGFKAFGADIKESKRGYLITADKVRGADFFFKQVTVTATESLMMLAVLAKGKTVLRNCAQEPEIASLADFLNKCGARIKGVGTSTMTIEGVKILKGGSCKIIPDRLEVGSFAIMAAATKSNLKITNCNPGHLESLWGVFREMGVDFSLGKNHVIVRPSKLLNSVDVKTHEYPGFATDIQSPLVVLLTQAHGTSMMHETIYEGRLFYTESLNKMGAHTTLCDPHRVIISGPTKLYGTKVLSPDIRAGIALVIAGLVASGTTTIENIYQIDRGYERIDERLRGLGADIERVND